MNSNEQNAKLISEARARAEVLRYDDGDGVDCLTADMLENMADAMEKCVRTVPSETKLAG